MKIAALYDIHGNLPALNSVLQGLESVQPDVIVIGGDIVSGPMPQQTLERLWKHEKNIVWIRGNADREVVAAFDDQSSTSEMPEYVREITQWTAGQLEQNQRDFLASLPEVRTLSIEGLGNILFCHATPHSDEEIFTPLTPPERLNALFVGVEADIVVCGHTHVQFERQVGHIRIVNAGSVGMPYADQPGAYWLLLSPEGYEFRRTSYNLNTAAEAILKSGYPQVQDFVEENILKVPTAEEAIQIFERRAT